MTISNQIISFKLSGINYSGTSTELNSTSGVTPGTATASKAVILDAFKGVVGLGSISSTANITAINFIGSVQTASQTNITAVGTLSTLTVSGNTTISGHNGTSTGLRLGATLVTSSAEQLNYNNITTIGSGQASKALILDNSRNIININSLTSDALVTNSLSIGGIILNINGTQLNYNAVTTAGVAEASKTLILNSSRNISNINALSATSVSATSLAGTITTASQPNITAVGTLASLNLSGNITGLVNLSMSGDLTVSSNISAVAISGVLSTAAQPNITSVGILTSLTVNGTLTTSTLDITTLSLNSVVVSATATEINTLSSVVLGTASASKVLTLNSSKNVVGINSLASTTIIATNVTGSLQTAAQPNITSVGTLTGLTMTGAISGVTNLTMSGNLTGAGLVSASVLSGTLSTTAQDNVTSVGTLSSLLVSGNVGVGTTTAAKQLEINSSTGNCLRLSYNLPTGSSGVGAKYSDFTLNSSGDLTISTVSNVINLSSKLVVGGSSSINEIQFNGVTGDLSNAYLTERLYNGSDFSELLIFKGNDFGGASGPDRIRLRSAEMRFQIYTSTDTYSSFNDNNNAMVISTSGKIGINTTIPTNQLEINSATGNCLRLTYNDNNGSATVYGDINVTSNGNISMKTSSNVVVIGDSSNTEQTLYIGTTASTGTSGVCRITNFGGATYLQSGLTSTSGSASDFVICDFGLGVSASPRKFIVKADGKVGVGSYVPTKQLEINSATGACLRLMYNSSDGTGANYCDQSVSSVGVTTFTSAGTSPSFAFTGGNVALTISTASQPNITSLGTLTGLTLSGAVTGVTNLTLSGNLSGATSISATTLTGTLSTVAQTNITSVGTLSALSVTNNVKVGVTTSSAQDIVHIEGNTNDFIGIQIENRNTTAGTSGGKISFTGYTSSATDTYEVARIASITTDSGLSTSYQYGSLGFYTRNSNIMTVAAERMRITSNGYVGIGKTAPAYILDVSGTAKATSLLVGTSTDSNRMISVLDSTMTNGTSRAITFGKANSSNNQFELFYNHLADNSTTNYLSISAYNTPSAVQFRITAAGNVSIGTTTPTRIFEVNQNTSQYGFRLTYNNSTALTDMGTDSSGTMYIKSSNNATFIGDLSSTNQTLAIGGNTSTGTTGIISIKNFSGVNYIQSGVNTTSGSSADLFIGNYGQGSSTSSRKFMIKANGYVGIGNDSPVSMLDITGTIRVNSFTTPSSGAGMELNYSSSSSTASIYSYDRTGGLYKDLNLNDKMYIVGTNGNVGIGTQSPSYPLEITSYSTVTTPGTFGYLNSGGGGSTSFQSGNINVSLKTSAKIYVADSVISTSDRRIKKDINLLTDKYCKDFIKKTNPITYRYTNTTDSQVHHGYIAQDVYKAGYENLISIVDKEGINEEIDADGFVNPKDAIFTICYDEIAPILAKNIDILYTENEKLKQENTDMKNLINMMMKRLDKLEN